MDYEGGKDTNYFVGENDGREESERKEIRQQK